MMTTTTTKLRKNRSPPLHLLREQAPSAPIPEFRRKKGSGVPSEKSDDERVATENTSDNGNSPTFLPPGWKAFHHGSNNVRIIYVNEQTGAVESRLEDLFKKPRSKKKRAFEPMEGSCRGGISGDDRKSSSPRRLKVAPKPDAATSSGPVFSHVYQPRGDANSVPEVIDLVESEDDCDDSETDLEGPKSADLPNTSDFDWKHNGSDGGRDNDESDGVSETLV
jgi:hypothetical protein